MTMLSFRAAATDVAAADHWAARLGLQRSEILREALRRHLALLAAEDDVARWAAQPLTQQERALADSASWGPSEDWSGWSDRTDGSDAAR